jgi:hypothetical protein
MNLGWVFIDHVSMCMSSNLSIEVQKMKNAYLAALAMLLMPLSSHAGAPSIPEPGILPLLAVGGVIAVAIKIMKSRK